MTLRPAILALTILFALPAAAARIALDLDATIAQDSLADGADSSSTKSIYGGGLYLSADSRERFFLGAAFLGGSSVESRGTGDTTFAHQDVVLGGKWFIDQRQIFILSAGYGVLSSATLERPGAGLETWRGTSVYAKFTVAPPFGRFNVGMSLLYYQASYAEKEVGRSTSDAANARSFLAPGLALTCRF